MNLLVLAVLRVDDSGKSVVLSEVEVVFKVVLEVAGLLEIYFLLGEGLIGG